MKEESPALPSTLLSIPKLLVDFVQISRPGWWLVTVWLYVAPCRSTLNLAGLLLVCLPLNALVMGINDASDVSNDMQNERKGNFVFGPKGWSKKRLNQALGLAFVTTLVPLVCIGIQQNMLWPYMAWMLHCLVVNYLYNFHSFCWDLLLVFSGYGSVTLLSYWINNPDATGFGFYQDEQSGRFYFAGCNQEYWVHLILLLIRSQLWAELLDYESDLKSKKSTNLIRWSSGVKLVAQSVVFGFLALEALFCFYNYQKFPNDWSLLFMFSCMGLALFSSLEWVMPHTKMPSVDLVYLALMQNAGGIHLLYDCWSRGVFVK